MTDLRQAEPVAYFDFQDLKFSWAKHMKIGPVPVSIKVEPVALYLEAPKQQAEPTCQDCKAAVLYECVACSRNNYPPKQQAEPASGCACRWDYKDDRVATCERHQGWLEVIAEWADRAREAEAKLKAAQPERPWVGLTDEEILSTDPWEILRADPWMGTSDSNINPYQILLKVRTLEAKLKERNT